MTVPQILLSLLAGSTASSALAYKLYAKKVLLASTTQSFDALRVELPPSSSSNGTATDVSATPSADGSAQTTNNANVDGGNADGHQLVVIVGWGGAQMKHLRRLQDLYAAKGFATVVVLPTMLIYYENGGCLGASAELLVLLRDHFLGLSEDSQKKARLFFHLHSNTAVMFYYTVMRVMRFSIFASLAKAYSGTIYDSTPGHPSLAKIKVPSEFKKELKAFCADESTQLAAKPLLLRKSVAAGYTAAATMTDNAALLEASESNQQDRNPIVSLGVPCILSNPLPTSGSWRSTAFAPADGIRPLLWLWYAGIMAFVVTPLVLRRNQYFHWFWWPVSYIVGLKEYAHTSIVKTLAVRRHAQKGGDPRSEDIHTTRYGAMLTPNAIPSMAKVAALLADPKNTADGFAGDYEGALRHLNAVVSLDRLMNRDVEAPTNAPELFLFSNSDKMVLEEHVTQYLYTRAASGYYNKSPAMFVHKFAKSPHVAHLLKHPEAYAKCLDNFIFGFALAAKDASLALKDSELASPLPVLGVKGATSTGPLVSDADAADGAGKKASKL